MNGSKKPGDPIARLGNARKIDSKPTIKQQREIKKTHQGELEESNIANARHHHRITLGVVQECKPGFKTQNIT
jgi:hypothetical protein